jgi:hypothetical protein
LCGSILVIDGRCRMDFDDIDRDCELSDDELFEQAGRRVVRPAACAPGATGRGASAAEASRALTRLRACKARGERSCQACGVGDTTGAEEGVRLGDLRGALVAAEDRAEVAARGVRIDG